MTFYINIYIAISFLISILLFISFERKEKVQFNTDLYYEEKLEIDELLKNTKITKREFILRAKEELKKKIEDAKLLYLYILFFLIVFFHYS